MILSGSADQAIYVMAATSTSSMLTTLLILVLLLIAALASAHFSGAIELPL